MMLGGYYRPDTRPILERIRILPPVFLNEPELIGGLTFKGTPKVAGSDNHAHTPERRTHPVIYYDCTFNAGGAAEAEKLSRHFLVAYLNCYFVDGAEEPLDICRAWDLYFYRCDFESHVPEGRDLELKGSARRVTFRECYNLRQIRAGMYSKYDARAVYPDGSTRVASLRDFARPPVREWNLFDQDTLEVEIYHAEEPRQLGNTRARIRRPLPRPLVPAFFWARAKFFKEKLPVPPEEFVLDPREVTP